MADAVVALSRAQHFVKDMQLKALQQFHVERGVDVSFSQFSVFTAPTSSGAMSVPLYFQDFVFPIISLRGSALCCVLRLLTHLTTCLSAYMQVM